VADVGRAIVDEFARRWPQSGPATDPATAVRWAKALTVVSADAAWAALRSFEQAPCLAALMQVCAIEEAASFHWTDTMLVDQARLRRAVVPA
jgi:hypothetical protein